MITIKELAEMAKVSKATVSKALNDRPDISEETKKRIRDLAQKYDYQPNPFGRSLKCKKTENIGVVFFRDMYPISRNPFYSHVLEGLEAEITQNEHNLLLQFFTAERESTPIPRFIKQRMVDGLILIGSMPPVYVEKMKNYPMPLVLVDPRIRYSDCCQILMDNEQGAYKAIKYLIDKGHRRIGFISGDISRLSFAERLEGYKKALAEANIPYDPQLVRTEGLERGYEYTQALLKLPDRPTAIFTANDINAYHGYRAVHEMGLRIPDDVSFIGFDDIDLCKMMSPQLTTMRVDKEKLGIMAVRLLLQRVEDPDQPVKTVNIPVELVERGSVKDLNKG